MKIYLLLLLFQPILFAPTGRGKLKNCDGEPSEKKTCQPPSCYFSQFRKAIWETQPRPEKSLVSSDCSEKLIRIGDLFNWEIDPKTGEKNAVELLLCRGAGKCDINMADPRVSNEWKEVIICEKHADELLRKWGDSHSYRKSHVYYVKDSATKTSNEVCSMPEGVGLKHKTRPHDRLKPLKVQEADVIGKQLGVLVHPGIPICHHHEEAVKNLMTELHPVSRKRAKTHCEIASNMDDNSCDDVPNDLPSKSSSNNEAVSLLMPFAKYAGVQRVCSSKKPWTELKERTKEKKACAARKLIDVMLNSIAPDGAEDLKKRVFARTDQNENWTTGSSKNLENIMEQVAAQFFAAEERTSKLIVLSLVANSVPYSEIVKYIPYLSSYMYHTARKFARRNRNAELPAKKLERYYPFAVHSFIEFITSPVVMIGLPHGTRKVKMHDGSKREIPNSIRQQSASEIVNMYENMIQETNQPELALSKSSMFRILEVCAATTREATTCVDYFIAYGMEAFDKLHQILDDWITEDLIDPEVLKHLKTSLFESVQYLRTDYRLHVKDFSRVADHCANYALSDPNDPRMSSFPAGLNSHKHDLKCDRCELLSQTLKRLKVYAEYFISDSEDTVSTEKGRAELSKRKQDLELIELHTDHIMEMKKHMLRAAFTNQERTEIIDGLANNEALITLDFAQKYLPKWHREKQSDYFGKKGVSYHVSHVTARIGDKNAQHSFVHIYKDEVTQDSGLVILTIAHVLAELKKVGITKVSLRSDNAGAYHCASTISSLHWLNETTGVAIDSYTFSEAQNGKSSSDRDANRVKRKAEGYVTKGKDIVTSEQFFMAMKEGRLLNGVSVHHGTVSIENAGNAKWPGISNLNHFKLERNGIRGRRYGSIGEGQLVAKTDLKPIMGSYRFEDSGFTAGRIGSIDKEREAFLNGLKTNFWYHAECAKTSSTSQPGCIDEQDDLTPEIDEVVRGNSDVIGNLYSCPEPGCGSSFLKSSNLEKHVLRGKHKISPEKITMRDYALRLFVRQLEEVEQTRTCPSIADAVNELKETSEETELEQGWALPKKQKRKPFEEDVKKFLIECFDEGLKKTGSKKRLNPMTVASRMVTAKKPDGSLRFKVEERKDFRQIAGFFSRESEKRRTASVSRTKRENKDAYKEEYVVSEDEHPDAGWIEDVVKPRKNENHR